MQALEENDENKLHVLFDAADWRRHLEGYRLKTNENGTRSISSTPLLDIISRFPLLAGRIFYKLMTVDTKNGEIDDNISFEDFDVAIINQVRDS